MNRRALAFSLAVLVGFALCALTGVGLSAGIAPAVVLLALAGPVPVAITWRIAGAPWLGLGACAVTCGLTFCGAVAWVAGQRPDDGLIVVPIIVAAICAGVLLGALISALVLLRVPSPHAPPKGESDVWATGQTSVSPTHHKHIIRGGH